MIFKPQIKERNECKEIKTTMENEKQSEIQKLKLKEMEQQEDNFEVESTDVRGCCHYKRKAKFVVSKEV